MDRAAVFSTLSEIFAEVMDLDEVTLGEDTTADDIEEWDSLSHVRLVVAIEREYAIKFTNAEIEGLASVGDLVDRVLAKAAA